ncbi:glycoside hydrolase family 18 protein [Vibrio mimicus]|uniref:glycosyl hydrolase family 18 protein n=1 Tax=Vibrio mimicus TaxID=674 RepID=UPI0011D7E805|nr:glycosyl hydrolase family 18 protein [Vibrio mimicus]TXY26061.1 glycoside hydrolase family 18 protein [Vibrio mimicus]
MNTISAHRGLGKVLFATTLFFSAVSVYAAPASGIADLASTNNASGNTELIGHFFGIFDDNWEQRLREDTPFDKMDMVFIAFAHPYDHDGDGIYELGYENAHQDPPFTDQERIDQIVRLAREKNPDIKLLISEGAGKEDYWKSAQNPEIFAESVVSMMRDHDLDGFDMDYEIESDPVTLEQFRALITAVSQRLNQASTEDGRDDNPYLFTITPNGPALRVWDGKLVNQYVDYINLQAYWGNSFHYIDKLKQSGVDVSKMLIGLASESYDQPADAPEIYVKKAKEVGAKGVFAWRLDTDSLDQQSKPHYSIATKLWVLMGRDEAE